MDTAYDTSSVALQDTSYSEPVNINIGALLVVILLVIGLILLIVYYCNNNKPPPPPPQPPQPPNPDCQIINSKLNDFGNVGNTQNIKGVNQTSTNLDNLVGFKPVQKNDTSKLSSNNSGLEDEGNTKSFNSNSSMVEGIENLKDIKSNSSKSNSSKPNSSKSNTDSQLLRVIESSNQESNTNTSISGVSSGIETQNVPSKSQNKDLYREL